jgi:hypothetical protein
MESNIYTLLAAIQKRPGMYLRRCSLSLLEAFLFGYESALEAIHLENRESPPFRGFQSWVVIKLQTSEANVYWGQLLLDSCNGDEEKAFEKFFAF